LARDLPGVAVLACDASAADAPDRVFAGVQDAEDCVQETLLRGWREFASLRDGGGGAAVALQHRHPRLPRRPAHAPAAANPVRPQPR
jgi:hypothetical protein